MEQHWLRVLHLLGVVGWMGGVLAVAMVALAGKTHYGAARGVSNKLVNPAMGLAWVGGLTMLVLSWAAYARAPWMHVKLTLVVVASALTGVLGARIKRAMKGDSELSPGLVRGLAIGLLVIAIGAVVMAKLGNVWMPGRPLDP